MTWKATEALLPWASAALQVTAVVPSGKTPPEAGAQETPTAPSTASRAVEDQLTVAPETLVASAASSAGTVSNGPVESRTVTTKLAAEVLPCESEALQVTVVAPK